MYFTAKEADLIRKAAAAMPVGGFQDPGKAQLASLADLAEVSSLDTVLMNVDIRERAVPPKLRREQAQALRDLLHAVELTDNEKRLLPGDAYLCERALQTKRANALRYANGLRKRDESSSGRAAQKGR
jgi:hypothetical protein